MYLKNLFYEMYEFLFSKCVMNECVKFIYVFMNKLLCNGCVDECLNFLFLDKILLFFEKINLF